MENPDPIGAGLEESDFGSFVVYADFNCSFCHALNERLHVLGLDDRVEFRMVEHAPRATSRKTSFEALSELTSEVAEVRRRAPSTLLNVPNWKPAGLKRRRARQGLMPKRSCVPTRNTSGS